MSSHRARVYRNTETHFEVSILDLVRTYQKYVGGLDGFDEADEHRDVSAEIVTPNTKPSYIEADDIVRLSWPSEYEIQPPSHPLEGPTSVPRREAV